MAYALIILYRVTANKIQLVLPIQMSLCDLHGLMLVNFINRRDGVVVKASASQSVDLWFIPLSSATKDLKKWYSQLPCLALGI